MKRAGAILLCLFGALCARAFDSDDWHAKRTLLDRECERLQMAYTNCFAQVKTPAEDVTVTVESFPNGSVRAQLKAARAQIFMDSPYVWGEGVTLTEFRPDGTVQAAIAAGHCVIDRKLRCAWVQDRARAVTGRTVVEGEGIYFSFAEEYLKVTTNVKIVSEDLKMGGLKL